MGKPTIVHVMEIGVWIDWSLTSTTKASGLQLLIIGMTRKVQN